MKSYLNASVLLNFTIMFGIVFFFTLQKVPLIVAMTAVLWVLVLLNCKIIRISQVQVKNTALLMLLLIPAFLKPYFGLSPAFYVFSFCGTFGVGVWLARDTENLFKAFKLLYLSLSIIVGIILLIYRGSNNPFEGLIDGVSQNGIPAYLIMVQIGYSVMYYLARGKLPIYSCLFTIVVAFYGEGRGSLVVAFAILMATLAFTIIIQSKGIWGALWKLGIIVGFSYVAIRYGPALILYVTVNTKLSVGLFDINRIEILQAYVSKINLWTFLIGADYSGTIIEYEYRNNPHISMIRTHALFGLPVALLLFTSFFWVIWSPLPWVERVIVSSFLFLAILRSATEPLLFPTLLDGLYFSLIMVCFNKRPQSVLDGTNRKRMLSHQMAEI